MNEIKVICVGKIKEAYFKDAIAHYIKDIEKNIVIEIIELDDVKIGESMSISEFERVKNIEGQRIMSRINNKDYVITLEIEGKQLGSKDLQNQIAKIKDENQGNIVFIIGGSLGISDMVKQKSNLAISFSQMTFPHQFMRVILLEQLCRVMGNVNV